MILGLLLGKWSGILLVLGLVVWVVMGCWLGIGDGIGLVWTGVNFVWEEFLASVGHQLMWITSL